MSNTPLLTDASRLAATQNVANDSEGVSVHINGDWSKHYQMTIIVENWIDSCTDTIPNSQRLRIPLTVNGVDVNVVIPIVPFVAAASGDPPAVTTQPKNVSCGIGETAKFTVVATGAPVLTYLWFRNNVPIIGATSAQLAITNATLGDNGNYTCQVSNPFGQSLSEAAVLSVSFGANSWTEDDFWGGIGDIFGF